MKRHQFNLKVWHVRHVCRRLKVRLKVWTALTDIKGII